MRVERLGTWGNECGDMDTGLVGTWGHWDTEMGGEVRTVGDMGTWRHEGGGVGDVGRGLVGTLGHGDTEMGGEVRKVGM